MEPIISPVWIYLIHFSSTVNTVATVALFFAMFSLIALTVIEFLSVFFGKNDDDPNDEIMWRRISKWMLNCIIAVIVCILILVLVPDEKTMYGMIAASIITPDNISCVEDHVVDLIREIANAVYDAKK